MFVYNIYAVRVDGKIKIFSPCGYNKDKEKMLEYAKHLKYDKADTYKEVQLKAFKYELVASYNIEV